MSGQGDSIEPRDHDQCLAIAARQEQRARINARYAGKVAAERDALRDQRQGAVELLREARGYVAADAEADHGPAADLLRRIDAAFPDMRGR